MRYNPFDGYSYLLVRSMQEIVAHLRVVQISTEIFLLRRKGFHPSV